MIPPRRRASSPSTVPRAAEKRRIVIITANSPEFVAAKAGAKASFGTNPLCFACPVEGAQSVCVRYVDGGHRAVRRLDVQGQGPAACRRTRPTTPTATTRKVEDIHIGGGGGRHRRAGGHKGTGLALMVELLCAALAGGAVLGQDVKKTAKNWGHQAFAIDPGRWPTTASRAASIIKTVAASHSEGVRLPGDSSNAIAAKNKNAGAIPVPKRIWSVMRSDGSQGASEHNKREIRDPRKPSQFHATRPTGPLVCHPPLLLGLDGQLPAILPPARSAACRRRARRPCAPGRACRVPKCGTATGS